MSDKQSTTPSSSQDQCQGGERVGWGNQTYTHASSGVNTQGDHYCNRDYTGSGQNPVNTNSYHYSNANGSYYYSNPDGSTYYNDGKGSSTFTSPEGKKYEVVDKEKSGQ